MIKKGENMTITNSVIKNNLDEYANKDIKLSREVRDEKLFKIINRLYKNDLNTPRYLLTGSIYGLPYISFEKDIKIKFKMDINPPSGATYEEQYKLLPSPHQIKLYDKGSLLAGKIHAILCRGWKIRTKGRDLYDYVFFLANDTKVNIELIKNKLIESEYIKSNSLFDINILKKLLIDKFSEIDYTEAKEDVIPFIKNVDSLNIWSKDFFISITDKLQ